MIPLIPPQIFLMGFRVSILNFVLKGKVNLLCVNQLCLIFCLIFVNESINLKRFEDLIQLFFNLGNKEIKQFANLDNTFDVTIFFHHIFECCLIILPCFMCNYFTLILFLICNYFRPRNVKHAG